MMLKERDMTMSHMRPGSRVLRAAGSVVVLLAALVSASCDIDGLLRVSDPSRLMAEDTETPASARTLVNGVIADFECAFGAYVLVGGILSDELMDQQFNGSGWYLDRRDVTPSDVYGTNGCTNHRLPGIYRPASTARWVADNVYGLLSSWTDEQVPQRDSLMATSALYAGFSYSMLGTLMCSAALDGGPEVSSEELLAIAEERFTSALTIAQRAGLSTIENAARIGRARVRLYLGDGAGAVADARAVPQGFVFNATASADNERRYNRIYHANTFSPFYGVAHESRGLTTGGVEDPRTRSFDSGARGNDGVETVWRQTKYTSHSSPIPVARWEEAQLIIAEVEGGQTAVDIINALRAPHGLPAFASDDEAEILATVIEERRRELFLEGHRAYDIRRHNLPLEPVPGTPYQVGIKGGTYGDSRCLPLPDIERYNNPNIG